MCDHHQLRPTAPVGVIDHVSSLSDNLGELVENSEYSDITLVVENKKFPAHKVILAARSDYFRALLFGGMMESQPGTTEIELQETTAKPFEALLKYIYTGKMNLLDVKQEEHLLDILGMSHRYGFVELETSISEYLKAILNIKNVCLIYDLANIYSLKSLCNVCKEFMDRNASHILHSEAFLGLSQSSVKELISRDSFCAPEIEIFNAIREWASQNVNVDPTPILEAVRLPLMPMCELLNVVRDTNLVTADSILDAIKLQTESRDMDLQYRGFLVPEENIATTRHGAQVIRGEMKAALLDGDITNYDLDRGFTRHLIDDNHGQGIVIRLEQPYIINTIKLLLWDKDTRSYSYYLEISMDDKDYERIVDHTKYLCRSLQTLHFPAKVVKYIRVVGTHNTQNRVFHLVSFECMYTLKPFQLEQGLVVPTENVATIPHNAIVTEGVSRSRNALINGDIRQYDWDSGYTCHQLGSGSIVIQFPQPYIIGCMRLLLWDCDDRGYSYYIETSSDSQSWHMVCDRRQEACKSWQNVTFPKRPVVFIKIVGTHNTANEVFHCVHFEAPSEMVKRVSGGQLGNTARGSSPTGSSPQGLSAGPSQNLVAASMDVNVSQDFLDEPESERMDSLSDR